MTVNFKELDVEVQFDNFIKVDVRKALANCIHSATSDIGLDDVARAIYYSEESVVPDYYIDQIVLILQDPRCNLLASVKKAIIKALTTNTTEN